MKKLVVYIHGKGGSAAEAEHYKELFPAYDVIGFDYQAQTPWDAVSEFTAFFTPLRQQYDTVVLLANSIGVFFSMSALSEKFIDRALFISPIVNMETLISDMMGWGDGECAARAGRSRHRFWRNPVVGVSLLCAGTPACVECTNLHFVRRKRQSDLL